MCLCLLVSPCLSIRLCKEGEAAEHVATSMLPLVVHTQNSQQLFSETSVIFPLPLLSSWVLSYRAQYLRHRLSSYTFLTELDLPTWLGFTGDRDTSGPKDALIL